MHRCLALEHDVHEHDVGQVLGAELDRRAGRGPAAPPGRGWDRAPTTIARASVRILWSSQISSVTFGRMRPPSSLQRQPDAEHRTPAGPSSTMIFTLVFGDDAPADEEAEPSSRLLLVPAGTPARESCRRRLLAGRSGMPGPSSMTSMIATSPSATPRTMIGVSGGEYFAALSTSWRTTSVIRMRRRSARHPPAPARGPGAGLPDVGGVHAGPHDRRQAPAAFW